MKLIPLTQGQFAMVDDDIFDYLNQWKWGTSKKNHTYYAKRSYFKDGKSYSIKMHRLILGLTDPKILGEHIDHNGLNNQRNNLRVCTQQQNVCNKKSQKGATSKYLGVYALIGGKNPEYMRFLVRIRINGRSTPLGTFPFTEEGEVSAARRYNLFAIMHHKEFANINILP